MRLYSIFLFLGLAIWARNCECSKILAIFPIPSPSHYMVIEPLLKRLAEKGHEVTVAGSYPQKNPLPNFKDVVIEANIHAGDEIIKATAQGKMSNRYFTKIIGLKINNELIKNVFEDPDFQKLMQNPDNKFDLIIHDIVVPTALHGLGELFNASLVASASSGTGWLTDGTVGNISPASIIPNPDLPYDSRMNFMERLHSLFENIMEFFLIEAFSHLPQEQIYKKYFKNAKLSYREAISSFSLLLVNQHHSLSYPRPYVPTVIEIGGLHIPQNPDPLPKDMQQFLDNAPHGVIYFSMGSNIKSKDLPLDIRNIFLNVFRGLKQKVLWKFEDANLPNKPDNVFISQWCPQHAILKHPNVKVFITHGGLLSTTEAIFYGKPMIGIPMFAEQPRNVAIAVGRGISLRIDFKTITENKLKFALDELLYNPKYRVKVEELSRQYHDKPMTAMETAEFWIEYVLRHNGAKFLQNASRHLNLLQYYSLDCIAALLALVLFIIMIIKILLQKCFNALLSSKTVKKSKQKKN